MPSAACSNHGRPGVQIDDITRDRLKALADGEGMSMKDYLAKVAAEKEH
ncbi:hypothetical protein P6B95_07790 [Streptomyces atratus]|nr:hypothetical protein [Streptomyces atratus]WPW33773.1 hypothetical protein P6B95_07790 [Streptomyces atratus]